MRPLIIVLIIIAIAFMASAFLVGCAQRGYQPPGAGLDPVVKQILSNP